jgi:CrcB protein
VNARRGPSSRASRPPPSQLAVLLAIAIGGALGAPVRYGIAQLLPFTPGTFPWGTFWTNLSGAFVLGFFLAYLIERFPPTRFVRPFFGIGFLGAYTTFSTMAVETARLVKDGDVALGIGYTLVSIATGLLVAYLGMVSARSLPGRRVRVATIDEELEG